MILAGGGHYDLHFTRPFRERFVSSLSEPISRVTICSPFFDKLPAPFKDVIGFCSFMAVRGTEAIQIITRPPGKDKQAMTMEVAKFLATKGVNIIVRSDPYLHAKLYHLEYARGYYRCFVGSANFTLGGFERNYELVAELEGTGNGAIQREIARMTAGGAMPFEAWIARGQPSGEEEIT